MRSIEKVFKKISEGNPSKGAYICLAESVKGKKFARKTLVKGFRDLVPKEDYDSREGKGLVDHLELLTNIAVAGEISLENPL